MEKTPPAHAGEAIVLFAHGARDARWSLTLEGLRAALGRTRPELRVEIAYLELQEPRLATVLRALAAAGIRAVDIAPILWAQGSHVTVDLPRLLEEFRHERPNLRVRVLPVLSELPGMIEFLAARLLDAGNAPAAAPLEASAGQGPPAP